MTNRLVSISFVTLLVKLTVLYFVISGIPFVSVTRTAYETSDIFASVTKQYM